MNTNHDNKGKFTKGNTGKPKGAKNKKSSLVKALSFYLIDGGYDKFKTEFEKLHGKQFIDAFIGLAKLSLDNDIEVQATKEVIRAIERKSNRLNN
jgi:hypothetical protein